MIKNETQPRLFLKQTNDIDPKWDMLLSGRASDSLCLFMPTVSADGNVVIVEESAVAYDLELARAARE